MILMTTLRIIFQKLFFNKRNNWSMEYYSLFYTEYKNAIPIKIGLFKRKLELILISKISNSIQTNPPRCFHILVLD